jgi:hypothetical protein
MWVLTEKIQAIYNLHRRSGDMPSEMHKFFILYYKSALFAKNREFFLFFCGK